MQLVTVLGGSLFRIVQYKPFSEQTRCIKFENNNESLFMEKTFLSELS